MKITGSYTMAVPAELVYDLILNPAVLARCLPGTDHLALVAPDQYEMRMKLVISSIQGLFSGKVRIADRNPPASFRLIVEGSGKPGFMRGEGLLSLAPVDSSTEVRYDGEVQAGGMIAGVGQRLLDTTAKFMIRKFFEKLTAAAAQVATT